VADAVIEALQGLDHGAGHPSISLLSTRGTYAQRPPPPVTVKALLMASRVKPSLLKSRNS
jgi:hypothetical protein